MGVSGVETNVLENGEPAIEGEPRILTATCCTSTTWTPTGGAVTFNQGAPGTLGRVTGLMSQGYVGAEVNPAEPTYDLDVFGSVLGRGLIVIGVGMAIGLVASLSMTQIIAGVLFGVTATDPTTYSVVLLMLFLVACLACLVPARRALLA